MNGVCPLLTPTRPISASQEEALRSYDVPLGTLLDRVASVAPDSTAIVDAGRRLTYAQLADEVARCVARFRAVGVARGDVVTVQLPNWWETNVVMLALIKIGAVVNPVVPIYRDREVRFILDQCRPRAVVVPQTFRGFDHAAMAQRLVGAMDTAAGRPAILVVRPDRDLPADVLDLWGSSTSTTVAVPASTQEAVEGPGCGDIALLLYTSGTTADPKGVLHDHRTLWLENRSIIELFGLDGSSTVFMPSPVTHITGFLYGVLLPLMLAVPVAVLDVWDPVAGADVVDAEACRFTVGATPFLQGLVSEYESRSVTCPLEVFACGGADVPPELVRRARRTLDAVVVRVYGSSELPTVSCSGPGDDERLAADTDGLPIGGVECKIDAPDAEGVGELLVRGPELFLGYLDAELNQESFAEDGWFRTGDLASIDDVGAVTIRGRSKDIIVRGGENISVKEVEDLLYEHPGIIEVAVVAMPDPVLVEKGCAFVVAAPGHDLTLESLSRFLDEHQLARQKYPERLEVVEALPKTASGKIQKFVLRERVSAPDAVRHTRGESS